MAEANVSQWLNWAREIQALSQTGLTYSETEFDTQRYQRLREIAAEIVTQHTTLATPSVLKAFNIECGYATAKIDVRGAIVRDHQILLVQERRDRKWCMPGGWADVGEKPSEMVAREIWEESGFRATPNKIIGIYDANRTEPLEFFHAYKIVFLCDITGGEARTSNETMAVAFFDFDNLPTLSANRTEPRHLAHIQAHLQDPQRPTDFE